MLAKPAHAHALLRFAYPLRFLQFDKEMSRFLPKAVDVDGLVQLAKGVKPEHIAYAIATILGYETFFFLCKHRQRK